MYIPKFNAVTDRAEIAAFIHRHGFATVVTQAGGSPFASHLPVLYDENAGDRGILRSHMARANEQWRHFQTNQEVLCIFPGPHAYISPSWYVSKQMVPTWNYATVHVYGFPQLEEDSGSLPQILTDTIAKYEGGRDRPWAMDLPPDRLAELMKAIVGFTIRITRIEAKFKLGQNRSPEDQAGMLRELEQAADPASRSLAAFIQKQKKLAR